MPRNNHPKHFSQVPKDRDRSRSGRRDSQERGTVRSSRGRDRRLSVRAELRETPDVRKIARAVIAMALAQAEADAQAQAQAQNITGKGFDDGTPRTTGPEPSDA